MKVLLYINMTEQSGEQLLRLIAASIPEGQLEVCRTIESLSCRLKQPLAELDIAVLQAASQEELKEIFSFRHLFGDMRIILIVPNREVETIAMAHQLRPRFLSYTDGDFTVIVEVLRKMLEGYTQE
jgi:hypothetical protein